MTSGGEAATPRWRTASAARRIGYAVLPGEAFSYLLHLRPREWPIMVAHTTLGFLLAMGLPAALAGERAGALLAALGIWVVALNGGTLALNSAYDRDEGDVGYLDAPPPPPRRLASAAFALMALGQAAALLLPPAFAVAYALCFALSLLYSVPPARLKAVAGADWVINMIGFGTLTPFAGWAASGQPLTAAGAWTLLAFCPLFAALYPLTQLYQLDEDRARGDRTLAIAIGVGPSLWVAIMATIVAFACFGRAVALTGTRAPGAWGGLGLALAAWLAVLVPWARRHGTMSSRQHKRGMYRALAAWGVTDVAVAYALAWRG